MNSTSDIDAMDAARRVMNAVKRMRRQAARCARGEQLEYVDQVLAEEEILVTREVERLLQVSFAGRAGQA